MRLLTLLLVAGVALAGCAENGGTTTTTTTSTPPTATTPAATETCPAPTANPVWSLHTSKGLICVELYAPRAPITVGNMANLTNKSYFDGTKFHRVIADFMDQGGDPLTKNDAQMARWGTGGPGYAIQDEFACADGTIDPIMNNPQYAGRPLRPGVPAHKACQDNGGLAFKHDAPGVISMANSGANSGGSQFFLTAVATPHLDGAHPVFGKALDQKSVDVILAINKAPTDASDRPTPAIVLEKATIAWP